MNILVFSPYYPPHTGGLESHGDEFNKYLSRGGANVTVFTPRLPEDAPERESRHHDVQVIRFPAFELFHNYPLPKFWAKTFWVHWRELFLEDYDIVISRTRFFFPSLMATRFARKRHLPRVHIEHGSDFAHFNGRTKTLLGKVYDQIVGNFVLRTANVVIANSRASARFVCRLAKKNSCQVIYRGVEKEVILSMPPTEHVTDIPTGVPVIGFIGRLIDGKGVADLLKALAPLREKNFVFLIVGDGPERPRLEKLAHTFGIGSNVRFLGHQSFSEAIGYMKTFDIFVNPSHTEGIPTAVIEAALCRKAIVATNVGGTHEIITGRGDGFLVAPKNIAELSAKLALLLDNVALRESFGEKAFRAVEHKFSWDESIKKYFALFKDLLEK